MRRTGTAAIRTGHLGFPRARHVLFGLILLLLLPPYLFGACATQVTPVFDRDFRQVFLDVVSRSTDSIYLSIYIFKTDSPFQNSAADLQEALILAAKRGVEVHVLFEETDESDHFLMEANMDTARGLAYFGINCYFYSAARMHTKLLVVDEHLTLMGSHNYTVSALRHNREASVLIESHEFAEVALSYIRDMMRKSQKLQEIGATKQ